MLDFLASTSVNYIEIPQLLKGIDLWCRRMLSFVRMETSRWRGQDADAPAGETPTLPDFAPVVAETIQPTLPFTLFILYPLTFTFIEREVLPCPTKTCVSFLPAWNAKAK